MESLHQYIPTKTKISAESSIMTEVRFAINFTQNIKLPVGTSQSHM